MRSPVKTGLGVVSMSNEVVRIDKVFDKRRAYVRWARALIGQFRLKDYEDLANVRTVLKTCMRIELGKHVCLLFNTTAYFDGFALYQLQAGPL